MKRKVTKMWIQFKGAFYVQDYYDCSTLQELMYKNPDVKRKDIVCQGKEYN